LEFYLLGRLPEDSISSMESHLVDCAVCDERLVREISLLPLSGVVQSGTSLEAEKRRERRYDTEEGVSLQALSPFSTDRYQGKLADVSRNGMKIQTRVRAESGTLLKISLKNVIAFGEVRYCLKREDGFHCGVRLTQVVQVRSPHL
jgi:PilZ domain